MCAAIAASFFTVKMFPFDYIDLISQEADKYDIDTVLVLSLIRAESNFNPAAVSPKNAIGLMQVTPTTGEWCAQQMGLGEFRESLLYQPEYNIKIGVWYLSELLKLHNGDTTLALSAYNAGRGNVQKWLDDATISRDGKTLERIPFPETENYLKRIDLFRKVYRYLLIIRNGLGEELGFGS